MHDDQQPGGRSRRDNVSRAAIGVVICGVVLASAACVSDPPGTDEIRAQTAVLGNIPLSEGWKEAAAEGPVMDDWLASFGDAELNALVAEAMLNNTDLRVSATRVEQAGQYVEMAKAALRPAINIFGSGGVNTGGGDALQIISLGASWELDLWGRMRYGRNAYEATYASAQADFEFGRQSLAATMAKAWFTATETWLQLKIAEDMVRSAQELVSLAETRRKVGAGSEQDVALAHASLGNFQDTVKQVQLAHSQSLRAVELLLGRYPGAELKARHDLPVLPGPVPAGLPLEMLERRPDMIAAERRVAAAFNRVGEAKAARLPRLTLTTNVAALQSDILELKSDFENPTAGAGARLVAPLYQGGGLQAQVEIRTLQQQEAVAQYASLALRALGDVENTLAAAQTLAEREQILQRTLVYNQRALALVQTSYRVGTTDLRSVQLQQLDLNSASLALLRVQSEQLAQRANLHLVIGGSFDLPTEPAAANEAADASPALLASRQ